MVVSKCCRVGPRHRVPSYLFHPSPRNGHSHWLQPSPHNRCCTNTQPPVCTSESFSVIYTQEQSCWGHKEQALNQNTWGQSVGWMHPCTLSQHHTRAPWMSPCPQMHWHYLRSKFCWAGSVSDGGLFSLHFANDWSVWASLHVLIVLWELAFCELTVPSYWSFSLGVSNFFLLSFWGSSLKIFGISPLSILDTVNTSAHFVICELTFIVPNSLVLILSNPLIFLSYAF